MTGEQPAGDLRLVDVTKRYGAVTAVDGVRLTVPQGSFFALLGASGCGKTTTLRMIAGLEEPTAGRVLLGGEDITGLRPYRRPVNTVFQSYALFPHLDVFDNVAFGLRRRKVRDVAGQVERMLSMVQLDGYARRRPAQLSGGQQQRVALARALVTHPRVLLLDEPLGALDLKLRRRMQLELTRIQTAVGITFVHVTHDPEEALTMADTVAVMNAGRIEQLGSPAELYDFPATAFVANFLGQSNLLAGEAAGRSGHDVLVTAHGARFSGPAGRARADHGPVFLGVRPEKLHLVGGPDQVPAGHQHLGGVV
ncbi:MAG TPA: ATP-binding cassette domain-containing protein, partial [Micromonospora sp.]